jgi:hypothetical protein
MYSSLLDPYEPPRPRPVYDNPQVVKRRRSFLAHLLIPWKREPAVPNADQSKAAVTRLPGRDGCDLTFARK